VGWSPVLNFQPSRIERSCADSGRERNKMAAMRGKIEKWRGSTGKKRDIFSIEPSFLEWEGTKCRGFLYICSPREAVTLTSDGFHTQQGAVE
jgi:hypothetical protein